MDAATATAIRRGGHDGGRGVDGGEHGCGGDGVSGDRNADAADAKSEGARGPVGDGAAGDIAEDAEQEGQAGEEAEGLFFEAAVLRQISGQPGHDEVRAVAIGQIGETQAPHIPGRGQSPEEVLAMVGVAADTAFGFDEEDLGLVDAGMVARFVAKPAVPGGGPDDADESADHEDTAPGKEGEEPGDEQRRDAAGNVRGGKEEALHAAALAQRNPTREGERGIGPGARFSGAEEEADDEQAGVVPGTGGGHGECRPPDDDTRQHAARADLLTPPGAEDFELRRRRRRRR